MARKPKSTAGAAAAQQQTAGGAVTPEQLEAVRNQPEVHAAVTTLQPFSTGVLGLVQTLTVRNEMERHVMADVLRQIKTAQGVVEDKFGAITRPMWQAWRAVKDWERQVVDPLAAAEAQAKQKLGDYELAVEVERRRRVKEQEERAAAERMEREREREQREREYPQPYAIPATPMGTLTGFGPIPTPTAQWQPSTTTTAPSTFGVTSPTAMVWEPAPTITPTAPPPTPLAGVNTTMAWAVEITDEHAAVAALIAGGVWDLRTQLGVLGAFVQLDASALNIAVRGDGEVARLVRGLLAQVPGLKVVERATVRARGYE